MSTTERPRILCIEDNPVNWRLVNRLLTQAGFETHWAEEGLKGFEMALDLRPDLVLLDINLPGLSGYEVAAKFRHTPELQTMKVVALTAKTLKSERETALVAGCDGFIPKPIDPFTFVQQVYGYMGGQKDAIEQGREGVALRQLNVQVLQHLEAQLQEAQTANAKLLEAQNAIESRNQSLARLLSLSQQLLLEHEPEALLRRVLDEAVREFQPGSLCAYRIHPSGGYWHGLLWRNGGFEEAPIIPGEHDFLQRIRPLLAQGSLHAGARLRGSRPWEAGVALEIWGMSADPCLVLFRDRQNEMDLGGFWALSRPRQTPFSPVELETLNLYTSLAVVNLENAELIENLNMSSRALASSYERMEAAYQDLQAAKQNLLTRDRQVLLEDLFVKMAKRLSTPVATLTDQVRILDDALRVPEGPAVAETAPRALASMHEAVLMIDGLLKALTRRTRKADTDVPEWLELNALITQEMELLHADLAIGPELQVKVALQEGEAMIFGVYGDFARILASLLKHALHATSQPTWVHLRAWVEGDVFHLEVQDDGGEIPPTELAAAFEPFSLGHEPAVMGVRVPGKDLVQVSQTLTSYHGEVDLVNIEGGTRIHLSWPLR